MSLSSRRVGILIAVAAMVAAFVVVASNPVQAADGHTRIYRVTVENLTQNQSFTPGVVATHSRDVRVFRPGRAASKGLQQLAENGGVPVLAEELGGVAGVSDVQVAGAEPIAPGESVEVLISADPGAWRLSLAAMLICTNDGFAGVSKIGLPGHLGRTNVTYGIAYDAGTEINTESYVDLVPPCDGLGQTGESNPSLAQNGVVRRHRGIKGHADLTKADHGWDDPVVKVTVERVRVYDVTIENLTSGQPLTPFVFATHRYGASVFEKGQAASTGVQQLAENGGVPVLVEELSGAAGIGTVGVVGSEPIAPGAAATAQIVTTHRLRRASLAGMLICTNDGFGGIDTLRLPYRGSATYYARAYDAGTEINTEAYTDLVPPCNGLGQTGETNPALAENGVVHRHHGIRGGADLDPMIHGWRGPVAKITIERAG